MSAGGWSRLDQFRERAGAIPAPPMTAIPPTVVPRGGLRGGADEVALPTWSLYVIGAVVLVAVVVFATSVFGGSKPGGSSDGAARMAHPGVIAEKRRVRFDDAAAGDAPGDEADRMFKQNLFRKYMNEALDAGLSREEARDRASARVRQFIVDARKGAGARPRPAQRPNGHSGRRPVSGVSRYGGGGSDVGGGAGLTDPWGNPLDDMGDMRTSIVDKRPSPMTKEQKLAEYERQRAAMMRVPPHMVGGPGGGGGGMMPGGGGGGMGGMMPGGGGGGTATSASSVPMRPLAEDPVINGEDDLVTAI